MEAWARSPKTLFTMQSDRRLREVLDTTQENLEVAVGAAYSRWTELRVRYVEPCVQSVSACCLGQCLGGHRQQGNNRRESFDFFFDRYDEEDLYAPDEMERLLDSEEEVASDEEFGHFAESGGGGSSSSSTSAAAAAAADASRASTSAGEAAAAATASSSHTQQFQPGTHPDMRVGEVGFGADRRKGSSQQPFSRQILQYYAGSSAVQAKSSVESFFYSLFPFWKKSPRINYRPSAAGLKGVSKTRKRSSTKSSTQSSETYRSRGDLFSDGEYDNDMMADAQIVSDNFASMLTYGRPEATSELPENADLASLKSRAESSIESIPGSTTVPAQEPTQEEPASLPRS